MTDSEVNNNIMSTESNIDVLDVSERMSKARISIIRDNSLLRGRVDGLDRICKKDVTLPAKSSISNLNGDRELFNSRINNEINARGSKANSDIGLLITSGLTDDQLNTLRNTLSMNEVKILLGKYLNIKYINDPKRHDIILDFHFYNYAFCKEIGFGSLSTRVFMGIMGNTWYKDMNPPPTKTPTMENSYDSFIELVLKHSVNNPPQSTQVFSRTQVSKIIDFACSSYFMQFRLYQYLFTNAPRTVIVQEEPKDSNSPKKGKKGKKSKKKGKK